MEELFCSEIKYVRNGKALGAHDYREQASLPAEETAVPAKLPAPDPAAESKWLAWLSRGAMNIVRGGKSGGAAGCDNKVCQTSSSPFVEPLMTPPVSPRSILREEMEAALNSGGLTLTWETEAAVQNCDGNVDNFSVLVHFPEGDETFSPDPVTHKVKIVHTFKSEPPQLVTGEIRYYDPNSGETIALTEKPVSLWRPVIVESPVSECYAPEIRGDVQTDPAEVYAGQEAKLFIPLGMITPKCGSGEVEVYFVLDGKEISALKDNNNYYFLSTFPEAGWVNLTIIARQDGYESVKTTGFAVKSSGPSQVSCSPIPEPGAEIRQPNISEIVKGDNRVFTWTRNHVVDNCGEPLILVSHNASDILDPATADVSYDNGTLSVTGRIKASVDGGSMQFHFQNSEGSVKTVNLYLPVIDPLTLKTSDNFIQQGENVPFYLLQEVPGAQNYHFWVSFQNGDKDPMSDKNLADSNYTYKPSQTGAHLLNLEVRAYDGTIIYTNYPFGANDAPNNDQACYDFPAHVTEMINPYRPWIVRGDGTQFTWAASQLNDCLGSPLSLFSSEATNIIYNETVSYSAGNLSVKGQVRSSIGGGAMRFIFNDSWGHTKIVDFYPPTIVEPEIVITDPWITVTEDVALQLLSTPAASKFEYFITRPGKPVFDSGVLTNNSLYTLSAAEKNAVGTYSIRLAITGADNYTFNVPGAFAVKEE